MAEYVWQHGLAGEVERLALMSEILDPWSHAHMARIPVEPGWRVLEVGAGSGSLAAWVAATTGPEGDVVASDIDLAAMPERSIPGFRTERVDMVGDDLGEGRYDLVMARAVLHHLPQRRDVVAKLLAAVRPGGWIYLEEPDFHPTLVARPEEVAAFWREFLAWAADHGIDYMLGRRLPPWLAAAGAADIVANGRTAIYRGGDPFARWWAGSIGEVAPRMLAERATSEERIEAFLEACADPDYWTMSIAFTGVTARRP